MRPFVRSWGLISTVTLSPVVILMKCLRILPEMWPRTSWPFVSRTRYIVAGSTFTTSPLATIRLLSFAMEPEHSFCQPMCGL